MGRKDKEEERDRDNRESRKRRHEGRSKRSASRSRSKSRDRDRDVSKTKRIKQERDTERVREERSRDTTRDARDKDRIKKNRDEREYTREKEHREHESRQRSSSPVAAANTNETSISIEETNRIRAELGLKPLDVGADAEGEAKAEKKDVHVPAINLGQKKRTEDLKRKLDERKEKRKIEERLAHVRTIAQSATEEDDDVTSWVEKSRKIQKEKEEAEKRAKLLEEMDEALGVGELVQTELVKQKTQAYTSKHLRGMRVEHDQETFGEGKEVVLTLKDQNVLGAEDDVLVNVNMLDDERYKKNNEVKKQRPGYQPYEDEEMDDLTGAPKARSLLAKYDSEIDGEKKSSFVIGGEDEAAKRKVSAAEQVKLKLKLEQKKIETLESRPMKIASEYFTEAEMASFKKVKRRVKKIRPRNQVLKADDLVQEGVDTSTDLGSRSRQKVKTDTAADDDLGPTEDLSGVKLSLEDSHVELRQARSKIKRLNERKPEKWDLEAIVIKQERKEPPDVAMTEEEARSNNIVLNATAEFCRTLGEIPTYGMAGNRDEDEDDLMDFERQLAEERRRNQEKEERRREVERLQERGGWNVPERSAEHSDDSDMETDRDTAENAPVILDEEPDVGSGMAAALKLAMSKGYLEKEEKKRAGVSKSAQELLAQHYTIEDKAVEDDKYSRRNRYDGPLTEFKEKEGYKPDVKLEYMGDDGKMLSTKEAFRYLSHKFHGKGSGKLKSEKRAKKQDDKMLMNRMSSTDTPLHTLKKLQDKQKELQSPYVVLSGKLTSTSIVKPGKGKK